MTQTNENKTNKNKEAKKNFEEVITAYENAVMNATSDKELASAMYSLATACTYSVIKKCVDVSADKTLITLRNNLTEDLNSLSKIKYIVDNAFETKFNEDGEMRTICKDGQLKATFDKLMSERLSDGMSLVHDGISAMNTEVQKARENGRLTAGFMTEPYYMRKLDKRVIIKFEDSAKWGDKVTTPIQEVFKAIRAQIIDSRSARVCTNGYLYLSDLVTDEETGISEEIYRRFNKYADIGGYVVDFNGAITAYTADEQTAVDTYDIIKKLDLTVKQNRTLELRLSGCGLKAIGSYYGITPHAVKKTLEKIQKKSIAIGLVPSDYNTDK